MDQLPTHFDNDFTKILNKNNNNRNNISSSSTKVVSENSLAAQELNTVFNPETNEATARLFQIASSGINLEAVAAVEAVMKEEKDIIKREKRALSDDDSLLNHDFSKRPHVKKEEEDKE